MSRLRFTLRWNAEDATSNGSQSRDLREGAQGIAGRVVTWHVYGVGLARVARMVLCGPSYVETECSIRVHLSTTRLIPAQKRIQLDSDVTGSCACVVCAELQCGTVV